MRHNAHTGDEHEAHIREIAGEGDLDERCRRILRAKYQEWFGREFEEEDLAPVVRLDGYFHRAFDDHEEAAS